MHTFQSHLSWSKHPHAEDPANRRTLKNHQIAIDEKETMTVSAAKAFKGDPSKWNPEDMLLSSLMSCHMMSYLYVCSQHGVEVISYKDDAEAILEVNADGSGQISKVILKPLVTITDATQIQLAIELHHQANQLCFIANSCNFEVVHQAECQVFTK